MLFSPAKKKAAKETGDLVGNKIADIIAKLWRILPQNELEKVESQTENIGFDSEIFRERNLSLEIRGSNYSWSKTNIIA